MKGAEGAAIFVPGGSGVLLIKTGSLFERRYTALAVRRSRSAESQRRGNGHVAKDC